MNPSYTLWKSLSFCYCWQRLKYEARPSDAFLFLLMLQAYNLTLIVNVESHQINNTGLFQNLISSSQHSRHICMVNIEIQKLTFLISKPGFETQQHKYVSLKSTTLFSLLHNELREVKTTLTPLLCHIFQFLNTLTITALATYLCCPSKIQ